MLASSDQADFVLFGYQVIVSRPIYWLFQTSVKNKSISLGSSKHVRRSIINGFRFICWLMFFSWYLWWISNTKESTFKINRILVNRMVHINCTKKCWYFSNILGHDSTKFWFAFVVFIWYPQQYDFSRFLTRNSDETVKTISINGLIYRKRRELYLMHIK